MEQRLLNRHKSESLELTLGHDNPNQGNGLIKLIPTDRIENKHADRENLPNQELIARSEQKNSKAMRRR